MQDALHGIDAEVLVVDNASVDGSVEMVKEKFPMFTLIESSQNLGFSKGNNLAIRKAKGEYVLLLNPDTFVEQTTLIKCCDFMDSHPDAGGLGIYMVDGSGNYLAESKRGLPTPLVAFYKIAGLAKLFPKSKRFGQYHLGYLDKNQTHQIEVLSGAFMMLRAKTLEKTGLLDEDYFMYGEDIDLSYCITQAGFKNYYYPEAKIIHYKGESTKRTSVNYVFVFYNAMIIFAKKHFSTKNAKLFSFLIYIAIYLKAGVDITVNFFRTTFLSWIDAGLIFGVMYLLKAFWEMNYKPVNVEYPPEFMKVALPLYVLTWLSSNHLSGGNDKPTSLWRVLRGVAIGTLMISAFTNFFDAYRFSKALILIGGGAAFLTMSLTRWVQHYFQNKTWKLSKAKPSRIAIVGAATESQRVYQLLKAINANVEVVGFVSMDESGRHAHQYLGTLAQINEVIGIHDLEELIFCSKDIPADRIIDLMVDLNTAVSYKIVPANSDYVIGSNDKDAQGDLYTIDIKLNITERYNIRNKRIFDICFSLGFLCLSPLLIWWTQNPGQALKNAFGCLFGRTTWVGYKNVFDVKLPKIKKGIIAPSEAKTPINDYQYAKDYWVFLDLKIVLSTISKLGG